MKSKSHISRTRIIRKELPQWDFYKSNTPKYHNSYNIYGTQCCNNMYVKQSTSKITYQLKTKQYNNKHFTDLFQNNPSQLIPETVKHLNQHNQPKIASTQNKRSENNTFTFSNSCTTNCLSPIVLIRLT